MPRFSLANAPLSLFCLRRSDEDVAGHLNACAFFEPAAPCAFYVHTDSEDSSERWIEICPQSSGGEAVTIAVSVSSGNVTTVYQKYGQECIIRNEHILLAEKDFIDRMRRENFWKISYYSINNLWRTLEDSFRAHIFGADETKKTDKETRSPFDIRMTGAPRGLNMREHIPLTVWRERPTVDWLAGTVALPATKLRPKASSWSDVIFAIAGANTDTPTARRMDLIKRCEKLLTAKMLYQPYATQTRQQCFKEAKAEFDLLSEGAFDEAWRRACEKAQEMYPDTRWGRPGAPKKRT